MKPSKNLCLKVKQSAVDYAQIKADSKNLNELTKIVVSRVTQTQPEMALQQILPVLCSATVSNSE